MDTQIASLITSMQNYQILTLSLYKKNYYPLQVSVSFGLSLFHTLFNVTNIFIMIWFVNLYVYLCTKLNQT